MRITAAIVTLIALATTSSSIASWSASPDDGAPQSVAAEQDHRLAADWSAAINLADVPGTDPALNTNQTEGCPALSRDGRRLYFASNREGGRGGLDIWVSHREQGHWGEPVNVGEPVNTAADEFCPSPMRDGHGFLYVSTKPNGCGGADMYITRQHENGSWPVTMNLGCVVNSAAGEASPFIVDYGDRAELYFSSNRPGGFSQIETTVPDSDIYVSAIQPDGSFGSPALVPGVNTEYNDARPNVRRDGLEIIFDSDRPSSFGLFDLYAATRDRRQDDWGDPINLGSAVNTSASETRPWLSWNGLALYFGSTREPQKGSDLYVTTRHRR